MFDRRKAVQQRLAEQKREAALVEIGGHVNFDGMIRAAVERARKKARLQGDTKDMFGTWHQHNGTKTNVYDALKEILEDLGLNTGATSIYMLEWERQYGSGQHLYMD